MSDPTKRDVVAEEEAARLGELRRQELEILGAGTKRKRAEERQKELDRHRASIGDLLSDTSLEARIRLESIIPMEGDDNVTSVRSVTDLSPEAIDEHYPHYVIQLTTKRRGMLLRNALMIAAGRAERRTKSTAA